MRKIIVTEFMTLDGVIEAPGGDEGFKYAGWTMDYGSEAIGKFKFEELFASDALLLGRVTYQGFAAAWPTMEGTGEFGERMNNNAKYVVSTTLQTAEWNNSHIIRANVVDEIKKLKNQPGMDILVGGSANLIQTLIKNDLVDQYRLLVYPVVLGSGKRLFQDGTHTTLKLIESKDVGAGVVSFIYEPDKESTSDTYTRPYAESGNSR